MRFPVISPSSSLRSRPCRSAARFVIIGLIAALAFATGAVQAQTETPTPTITPTPTTTPVPTFDPAICYAVPASSNNLITIDANTAATGIIGPTGSGSTIRGLAIPPVGNTLYAATATQLGTLNPSTGAYTGIGSFGTAINGVFGPIRLDNLVALTYDSSDGVLYGAHRTTLDPDVCFAVEAAGNTLVTIDRIAGTDAAVGVTANGIEAIALVGSTLYGAVDDQFGVIDRNTGVFTPNFANFGQGDPGPIDFDDVRGLSFDTINRVMFASSRRAALDDVLFIVDLVTGARVPLQFAAGTADYVSISGGSCVSPVDIEALAMNLAGTTLFGSNGVDLVTINTTTGACNIVGPFGGVGPAITMTGLGFGDSGTLYGTDADTFYAINTGTGEASAIGGGLSVGNGYRGVDCPISLPDVLFRIDPASGSHVPLHFDFGDDDYATIEGGGCGTEVSALAYDPFNNTMLGIDATNDRLMDIDKEDGFCSNAFAGPLGFSDIVAMTYSEATNTVFATGNTNLYSVNRDTGAATVVAALGAGTDYQALECPTRGCRLTVRKRHIGVPFSNGEMTYRIFWLNPCEGMTFTNVVLTDVLPPGLELISATSTAANVQTSGGTVSLLDSFLAKGPAEFATLRTRITSGAGANVVNSITLRDNFGREFTASDTIRVRESRTKATLNLHAQSKSAPGKSLTFTGRYQGIAANNSVSLTLPSGVLPVHFFPAPTTIAGNLITWTNLPAPIGGFRLRARISDTIAASTILTTTARLQDSAGTDISSIRDTIVTFVEARPTPAVASASVDFAVAKQVKSGLVTTFSVRYRNVQGVAAVTVTLPPGMSIDQTVPAAIVSGSTLTWPDLTAATGSFKVKALVSSAAQPGSILPVNATISDSGSGVSTAAAQMTVRN